MLDQKLIEELIETAIGMTKMSYTPYSNFKVGAALLAIGMFISSLTENQGFAAGIGVAVILFNYYSVELAEYVSATAIGSFICICILLMVLGVIVKNLTKNENLGYAVCLGLMAMTSAAYFMDNTKFEGLLPLIMKKLSLFEQFYVFVNGVFDVTGIVYYVTVMAFFLFLTVQSLEKRRYN